MQDYVTKDSLAVLGIQLKDEDADSLIAHLNETIEDSIGTDIIELLSDPEVEQLVTLQESASDEEIGKWITEHIPEYEQVVQDNIDLAIADMVEATEGINNAKSE
jgi:hypothetical protein